jgi:hypothetical protein
MISPRPRPVATEQVHVRCFLGKEYNISSLYNFQAHAAYIATMEKMHNFIMIHNIAAGLLSTRISIDRSIKGLKEIEKCQNPHGTNTGLRTALNFPLSIYFSAGGIWDRFLGEIHLLEEAILNQRERERDLHPTKLGFLTDEPKRGAK